MFLKITFCKIHVYWAIYILSLFFHAELSDKMVSNDDQTVISLKSNKSSEELKQYGSQFSENDFFFKKKPIPPKK
jgi:hypothetical protein